MNQTEDISATWWITHECSIYSSKRLSITSKKYSKQFYEFESNVCAPMDGHVVFCVVGDIDDYAIALSDVDGRPMEDTVDCGELALRGRAYTHSSLPTELGGEMYTYEAHMRMRM